MSRRPVWFLLLLLLCTAGVQAQSAPPQQFADLHTCPLDNGQVIEQCRLGYRLFGTLNAARDNAVLFPMWFTGRSGEVGALIGPGPSYILDTTKYFVIVVDPFANGIASSPSNSSTQPGVRFPKVSIRDMVHAEMRLVRDTLHVQHLHAVVGQSMGGMQTFEWAVDAPRMADLLVSIVGTPQLSSYDMMLWSTEEQALLADPAYNNGHYGKRPALPLVAEIHQMNLSSPEFRVDHTTRQQFPAYFDHVAREMNVGVDANDYLRQLQAMLTQDIAHGGDIFATARSIKAKMLIINASQDHMVNPIPPLAFARLIHAQTLVLTSDCGHMAPGCEQPKVAAAVSAFLAGK